MTNKSFIPFCVFALVMALVSLGGCGWWTNLDAPGDKIYSTCPSDMNCITGRFVDDVVSNLNYECEVDGQVRVRSFTDGGGGFSCPNGSSVKFYLETLDKSRRIDFGSAKVSQATGSSGIGSTGYLVVNPRTLTGAEFSESYGNSEINISRLLMLLDSDDVNALVNKPIATNIIAISDQDKEKLLYLSKSLTTADFQTSDSEFATLIAPLKAQLPVTRVFPSVNEAKTRFDASLHAQRAGFYYFPETFTFPGNTSVGVPGFIGTDGAQVFYGIAYAIYDRTGNFFGTGLASRGASSTVRYHGSNPFPLTFEPTEDFHGISRGGSVSLRFLDQSDAAFRLRTSGVLEKDWVIADSPTDDPVTGVKNANYRALYGYKNNDTLPTGRTGKWVNETNSAYTGVYTMQRLVPVAPTLDPSLWNTSTTPFPIHLKLHFMDSQSSSVELGQLGVSILENGNVFTDIDDNCITDIADKPVGVVKNIYKASSGAIYMTLSMVLSDDANIPAALRGVVLFSAASGSTQPSYAARVRVDNGKPTDRYVKFFNALSQDDYNSSSSLPYLANWVNSYRYYLALKNYPDAGSASGILERAKTQGTITATKQTCMP